jgi:hypothetical protein
MRERCNALRLAAVGAALGGGVIELSDSSVWLMGVSFGAVS